MYMKALAAAASLIPFAAGLPLDVFPGLSLRSDEPCKQVRDQAAKWMADNGIVPKNRTDDELFYVPATPAVPIRPSVALACLKSVPLHKDSALQQVNFLRPLFEWQSTVDYLRDPPQGYLSEGVDLIRGLDDIAAKLSKGKKGGYNNEFDFLADLHMLATVRPRDLHFAYTTLLLDLFNFPLGPQFVCISDDGLATPRIYLYDDVKYAQHGYTPSPVSTIDGVPAMEFMQRASVRNGGSHDPDARFNGMFPSLATSANLLYASPDPFALGLGDTTEVKCHNGTKFKFTNTAFLRANFTGITSGADLYSVFGQGNGTTPPPLSSWMYKLAERNYTSDFAGYPKAINATKVGSIAGFLPEGDEFSDVAVLAVNAFQESPTPEEPLRLLPTYQFRDFHLVTVDVLTAARAANRTKLILDLQGNGGGLLLNLMAVYFALFPGDNLPILWQGRAHPQYAWLGKQLWNSTDRESPWPLYQLVKPDGTPWASFEELYGPFPDSPDGKRWGKHTHPASYNVTRDLEDSSFPFPDGWRYQLPWTTPPFAPEDIVILTDGQCASACAITVEMLTHAHGVRTVALGGRPLEAPMQAVGQTKGGPVALFASMPDFNRSEAPEGLRLPPDPWSYKPPLRLGGSAGLGTWGESVMFNVANIVPYTGNSSDLGQGELPLQLRYEAANCRLFYTWDMARDITAVWKAVAGVAWRGEKCVPGSTTNADGTIGGVPRYTKLVEDRYGLGNGPGAVGNRS